MKRPCLRLFLLVAGMTGRLLAADEPEPRTNMTEVLRARLAEAAKKQAATPASKAAAAPAAAAKDKGTPAAAATTPVTAPTKKSAESPPGAAAAAEKTKNEKPTILPKVEVQQRRITELDREMHQQELDIAREQAKTKPTEMDKALNDSKVAKALSIFGGESNAYRANVAKERVSLMEEEKDLIEAIAHAKTKEEKEELRKQLEELKAMRRMLEKSLK